MSRRGRAAAALVPPAAAALLTPAVAAAAAAAAAAGVAVATGAGVAAAQSAAPGAAARATAAVAQPTAGDAAGRAAGEAETRLLFTYSDPRIDESSGLVDDGDTIRTANDSGDDAVVYTVDKQTGDTVATTRYSDQDVEDVEALAPGRGGALWVADIGDNRRSRSTVAVHRLPRRGSAERYALAYPDGPHDAEALLADPATGRLYVVSKSFRGGVVYAVPARLDPQETNRLAVVGRVPGLITDGAFFPDGRHVLLRSYGSAAVYRFPGLEPVGRVGLPGQEQGEAVAISRSGAIYLGSEGAHSDVLQVRLPAELEHAMSAAPPAPPATVATPTPQSRADPAGSDSGSGGADPAWLAAAAVSVLVGAMVLVRLFRPRGRRTR